MKNIATLTSTGTFFGILVFLFCWFSIPPTPAVAQGVQGQNAVYNSSNGIVGSYAFIDASTFKGNATDICGVLKFVLANVDQPPTYPSGAVIDARGLNSTNTSMTCTTSPWAGITNPPPSTILLPATGGASPTPIIIPNSSPWILPSNTHLIGEGDGIRSTGSTPGTTIQAKSGFSGSMIQFGSSTVCPLVSNVPICTGISVENLTLDGQGPLGQTVSGIANQFSQDGSYVSHVSLYQILGTGLLITDSGASNANNSGPYSNITFDTGGSSGLASTVCAQILGLSGTHGIHGLSCNSETNDASAGGWPTLYDNQ